MEDIKYIRTICPLCDGGGRRVFPNCDPPIDELCPVCEGSGYLMKLKSNNK